MIHTTYNTEDTNTNTQMMKRKHMMAKTAHSSSKTSTSIGVVRALLPFLFGCYIGYIITTTTTTSTNSMHTSSMFDPPPLPPVVSTLDSSSSSSSSSTAAAAAAAAAATTKNGSNTNNTTKTKIIYGHLHYIKSAGTNINGQLASLYQNVCGNKGYSLDYYQYNERAQVTPNITYTRFAGGVDTLTGLFGLGSGGNRAQPGKQAVEEIGFESCDYISYECSWITWPRIVNELKMIDRNMKLELHIPCRDPIDHLMSLCNHKRRNFTCYDDDDQLELLEKEIQNCIVGKSKCNKYGCVVSSQEEIDNIRNYQMNIHEKYSKEYTMKTKLNKKQASSSSSSSIIIENGNNDENEEEREAPERSRRRRLRADNNDDNNNDNNNNKVLKKTIAHQKVVSANRGGLQFNIQLTNKNINPLIDTKCFNPIPLTPYINYVGDKLYPRYIQIESNKYFHRTSNAIHKPNLECLKQKQIDSKAGSKSSQLYINKVKQIIFQKYKYFNWCNDCMGTNNQLQL